MERNKEQAVDRFFSSQLKLHQLRILVALSEQRQVRLVAESFHVSQPAISKQIAEMESALGVDLVRRVGQRIEFTAFGHLLTNRAREILHLLNDARKDFDSLLSGTTGSLTLGVVTTVTPVLIPEAIAAFRHRAPNVSISLLEGTADRLIPLLEAAQIDMLVSRTPAPENHPVLHGLPIANDPLVLVVSKQHPLAFRMSPTWRDLDGSQWVLPPATSPVYHALENLLRKHDIGFPSGCIQSVSLIANVGMIARTSLIGLLPKTLAMRYVGEEHLAIVPLDISSILERVYVMWHAHHQSPTVSLMKECLEYCGQVYAGSGGTKA